MILPKLWGAMLGLSLLATVQSAQAQLQFAQPAIHVGTIYSGRPLVREFAFRNAGALPVEIVEAKGSCGCARPKLAQRMIAPGASGVLPVELNTLGQAAGANSWSVAVKTKHGEQAATENLRIDAELVREVSIEPAALQLFVKGALSSTLMLRDGRAKPLTIRAVQASAPQLNVRAEAVQSDVHAIHVEVAPDFPEGRHEEVLSIFTDDPDYRELTMPVSIVKTAKQRVSATPSSVVLAGRPVASKIVLLRDAEEQPVTVGKVSANHHNVHCSFAAGPGTMTTLRVRCTAQEIPPDGLHAEVQVEISGPAPHVVVIPVRVE